MATHSSILAWEIPWTEEPGWLQFMGLQRVRHDWATNTSFTLRSHPLSPTLSSLRLWSHRLYFRHLQPPHKFRQKYCQLKVISCLPKDGSYMILRWLVPGFFFFFLAGVWDLNSWTRDWTHVPSTGSTLNTGPPGKSQSLYLLHSLSSLR